MDRGEKVPQVMIKPVESKEMCPSLPLRAEHQKAQAVKPERQKLKKLEKNE